MFYSGFAHFATIAYMANCQIRCVDICGFMLVVLEAAHKTYSLTVKEKWHDNWLVDMTVLLLCNVHCIRCTLLNQLI